MLLPSSSSGSPESLARCKPAKVCRAWPFAGPLDWREARQRKEGWQAALLAAGTPPADLYVEEGTWSSASGERAICRLLDRYPQMDAVFAGNDQMALSVLQQACRSLVQRSWFVLSAFSGLCSALAGIVFSMSLLAGYGGFGSGMELDSIAAVVIGGTVIVGGVGNVIGTLFGVLIYGTIVSILQFNGTLSSWWTRIGVGVLTLIAIGIQSIFSFRAKRS
jgi:hypothetical protein